MKTVVMGLTGDRGYCFAAVPAIRLWSALGWRPDVVAIQDGREGSWRLLHRTLQCVEGLCTAQTVRSDEPARASQFCRAVTATKLSGTVMTTDADMWPLHPTFFELAPDGLLSITRPACRVVEHCYVVGPADKWRAALGAVTLEQALALPFQGDDIWLTHSLKGIARLHYRPEQRIHVSQNEPWPADPLDIHVGKEAYQPDNWARLAPLLPPDLADWPDRFATLL